MKILNRCVARVLIVCTLGIGMPFPVSAGIITTDQVVVGADRDQVRGFLDRADVRAQMEALGVDAGATHARVDALSDEEARDLAARIGELPAGGSVIGVLFAIFIILLVTDLLGLTKVFPFTRSVR